MRGNLLLQGQLRSQDHGGAGEQQQVVGTDHFSDAADQQQQGSGIAAKRSTAPLQAGAARHPAALGSVHVRPGRSGSPPIRSRPVRWSDPWVMSSSSPWPSVSSPITASALVSSQPPTKKPPRRSGEPQQQQQQQNDVDGRQRHAKPVGQQFRPDPGFRHRLCSERSAQSRRIKAASPMLTPKLTTPSRALQEALSLVLRKLLKERQGLQSSVLPSGSR